MILYFGGGGGVGCKYWIIVLICYWSYHNLKSIHWIFGFNNICNFFLFISFLWCNTRKNLNSRFLNSFVNNNYWCLSNGIFLLFLYIVKIFSNIVLQKWSTSIWFVASIQCKITDFSQMYLNILTTWVSTWSSFQKYFSQIDAKYVIH